MDGVRETRQRMHGCAAIHCYSPRRIVARLLAVLRRAKDPRVLQQRQKIQKEPTEFKSPSLRTSHSVNGLNGNEESGIHELEVEFEVELERLQLYLDEESAFENTQQERIKDSSTKSHSTSFGEIIDPQGASKDVSFGVSPVELERRLHELLEARLQERITDLDYALECARHKVIEKETEVTWWKDTARLISQHVPETSRFTFRLDPEAAFKLKGEYRAAG